MKIDITCTAVARPNLHHKTFQSYTRNIQGVDWGDCTLYMNIDPLPSKTDTQLEIINQKRKECILVAQQYFGKVKARRPKKPNYTTAYNWVWSNAKTEYILNLEDDWELVKPIHINQLIKHFQQCRTLYEVVLRAYTYRYPCTCTSPAILHRRYYGAIGGKLDQTRNPETQTHSRRDFGIFIPNKSNCRDNEIRKYVRVWPEKNNDYSQVVSMDIGREWLAQSPYMRPQMLHQSDPRYKKKDRFRSWIIRNGWNNKQIENFLEGL